MLAYGSSVPRPLLRNRSREHSLIALPSRGTHSGPGFHRRAQPLHALVLRPTGVAHGQCDGSFEHLDRPVDLPGEIVLTDGLQELGRDSPADVVCSVPTLPVRDITRAPSRAALGIDTFERLLRAEDGQVSVTDLNRSELRRSTNGTFVRFPDGDDEEELVPMRATAVPIGAEIIFGDQYLARFRLEDTSSID